jgi:SulP family sulfate permease
MAPRIETLGYRRRIARIFPFLEWLPLVNRRTLAADLSAGLTGAIVVLPQGVAFATIAGMPPEYGLYAGIVPAIVAALFGSSWHLVSGPTTAASIVLYSSLSLMAEPGTADYVQLAITLAFMVGAIEIVMGLFRLGALVNFISHSVVIGFTAGAGILIAANQVKDFFGLPIPRGATFHDVAVFLVEHFDAISPTVTTIGAVTLVSGVLARRLIPRVPYMIVAILAGSLVALVFEFGFGAEVPMVGALPSHPPPLTTPTFTMQAMRDLAPTALAVTLFALTEALSISRALAVRSGQHINSNQEFIGQGLSNVAGSFFSSYVATGSFNRSGLNYEAGARTPLAAMIGGVALLAVILLVAPFVAYLPNAAMAGILFLVAWGLIDFKHIAQVARASRSETAVLAVTFLATLFFPLEFAIFAGVLLSLLLYLNRTSHPTILSRVPNPDAATGKFTSADQRPECPQVKTLRIDGELFFGAVNFFQETLRAYDRKRPEQKHIALFMSGVNFVDVAGAEALAQTARRQRERGGGLYLINTKEAVRSRLRRGRYIEDIGEENMFVAKTEAFASIYRKLDRPTCLDCRARIFRECVKEYGKPEPLPAETPAPVLPPIVAEKAPKRILAVFALDFGDHDLAQYAWNLAQKLDAKLAFGHVAEWEPGFGFEGYLTPAEVEKKLDEVVRRKLKDLAGEVGASEVETLAAFPGWDRGVADLARAWKPDLVIVPSNKDHDLSGGGRLVVRDWECDAVIHRVPWLGAIGRAVKSLWAGPDAAGR